jgi:hypothetical protein
MSSRCVPCNRDFSNDQALQQHQRDSPAHNFNCTTCNRSFSTDRALAQHYQNAAVHAQSFDHPPVSMMSPQEQKQTTKSKSTVALKSTMESKSTTTPKPTATQNPIMEPNSAMEPKPTTKPKSTMKPKSTTKPKPIQKWSMYPSLHDGVSDLLRDDNLYFSFHEADNDRGCITDYDTNIMGQFNCRNTTCPAIWTSKKIPITIRLYSNNRYNAKVYYQSCKRCQVRSEPSLDSSYAERVVYRLRKWSGIQTTLPPYLGPSKGEHRRDLCEGCKDGHCSEM